MMLWRIQIWYKNDGLDVKKLDIQMIYGEFKFDVKLTGSLVIWWVFASDLDSSFVGGAHNRLRRSCLRTHVECASRSKKELAQDGVGRIA